MRIPLDMIAARNSDPATSKVNRDAFYKKMSQRDLILMTYHHYKQHDFTEFANGMTDEEVGKHTTRMGESFFDLRICYWKRCSELRKMGLIEPIGETRLSSAGQSQQVCRITEEGMKYVTTNLFK